LAPRFANGRGLATFFIRVSVISPFLNVCMLNLRNHHPGAHLPSGPGSQNVMVIPQLCAGSI
jgi:hypothetical protein